MDSTATDHEACVLVVDDDPLQLRLLLEMFAIEGVRAVGAEDAAGALRSIAAAPGESGPIGAIVLDLRLPDSEGSELIQTIVAAAPDARVIINTGYADLETAKDSVNLGAFAYFEKGRDTSDLVVVTLRGLREFAEMRMAAARRTLDSIVTHAPDLIAEVTPDGRVLTANRTPIDDAGSIASYLPPCVATGERVDAERMHHAAFVRECLEQGCAVDFECDGAHGHDESRRVYAVRVAPIDAEGGAPRERAVLIARDVTEARASEQRLREREEQLRQSQKMQAIGSLASGVAHDFNNLVIAIRTFARLAGDALPTDHAAAEPIQRIEEATEQAGAITRALLTYTRKRPLQHGPVDLSEVVQRTLTITARTMPAVIDVRAELAPEGTAIVTGDEARVQQVVMNLAINARDAMRGGGSLRVSTGVDPEDGRVVLRVADTGVGMSDAVLSRIFEPYFTTRPRGQGTGLGLSIIQGVVEEMGGAIDVESAPGRGTTFTVRLPRADGPAPAGNTIDNTVSPAASAGRAVVVDADEHVRRVVALMLGSMGYVVDQFGDAAAAADHVRASAPDALVIDATTTADAWSLARGDAADGCASVVVLVEGDEADHSTPSDAAPPPGVHLLRMPFGRRELEALLRGRTTTDSA